MAGDIRPFVHLRVHSAYSLLEGALPVGKLVGLAKADGMVAVGIADTGNLFGALEFSEKAAGSGIQPIIGSVLTLSPPAAGKDQRGKDEGRGGWVAGGLVLIAKDERGYANLMELTSRAYLDRGGEGGAAVGLELVAEKAEGLICLTGGPDGPVDRTFAAGREADAQGLVARLASAFGDRLYVELQRHGLAGERAVEGQLVDLAYREGLAIVASNEPYFATPDDHEAHDALICIAAGTYVAEDERRRLTREHYFKSQAEMGRLFADLPEAIDATIEIARRCAVRPRTRKPILPQFVATEAGGDTIAHQAAEAAELARQAREGLARRLATGGVAPGYAEEDYRARLEFELSIITSMKFPGYFLIVADFIKWAKSHSIPVGPGRGSGAGSVVAWALTITDLDPLRFGLLFERFLNPERVSMPDFDIDFCQDRRDEVIRYVQEKYGADRVAQIITFGKLQARAVLRDVGRVLQLPYTQVDRLCKLVPNNPANPVTLEQAIGDEPRLAEARDGDETVANLLAIGMKLEGLYRHASTHAAGVVIGDRPLTQLVPLYRDPRSALPATQFNMKWVEPAGLVKFDFLGLKTLTVIERAVELVRRGGGEIDLERLALDDRASYELLARGDTAGVFQLESVGMRESLKRLKPDRFEDIIAMVSLYRPGPMENIPTYINRKHGLEAVEYPHPLLEPILGETYGVIIYQEQVMQIAQVLSGYSLGEADLLRRAMGKKIKEEMAQQRTRFVDGAVQRGVDKAKAGGIFDLVDKFAGYGFNKSHAAAYALLAYQTAYLKANHPVAFLAASMTFDMGNTDKLTLFCREASRLGIEVRPPCVNASGVDFSPEGGAIRYALAAIKSIGRGVVEQIEATRARGGPFESLDDFAQRIDARAFNRRTIETLAAAGAFDALGVDRATVHANAETIMATAQRLASDRSSGQIGLFAVVADEGPEGGQVDLRPVRPWVATERLTREFDAVGFYLTGHPIDQYASVLEQLGVERYAAFADRAFPGLSTTLAATVTSCRIRRSAKGNKFAFAGFSDPSGQFEAMVFSELLTSASDLLETGTPVLVHVHADGDDESLRLRVASVESLDVAANRIRKRLTLRLGAGTVWSALREGLASEGAGRVRLEIQLAERHREVVVELPGGYDVSPGRAERLRALPGVIAVVEG
ncbi:MAG: DNA polymerase III subunit alpha [Rhizobiales bacterium]|nr:DNA polymerase III subunit alpha [Hyphomicrobiales bacterium]